jgi:NAD-dependent dihydropyrimidine dehydrogenase PreA subunit
MVEMPIIDLQRCDGCGLCVGVCHCGALAIIGGVITITESVECDWCTDCETICPTGAISCPFEIIMPLQ